MSILIDSPSINYFLHDYWEQNGDPLTSTFPGMKTPWFFFLLGIKLIILIKFVVPSVIMNKKPIDIKPLGVISAGLGFGTTSAGLIIILSFTTALQSMTDCNSYKKHTNDLNDIVLKYVAYGFIMCKVFDFIKPLISSLGKKDITTLSLIQLHCILMFSWLGAKLNPGGTFIMFGILDTIYQILVYGYLVFAGASIEMRPSIENRNRIKNSIRFYRWLTAACATPYNLYHILKCDCLNYDLQIVGFLYIATFVAIFPFELKRMQMRERIDKKSS